MAACLRCGEENPDRARFCLGCGAPLSVACASCGEANPPQARFCLACGAALAPEAPTAPPRELRKIVTVVFCDVTGSTTLGEHLDPESLRRVMGRYFDEMGAALQRHGGTVEKFIGDAVMAVFGIPSVHEDDALRAVRAAAEMRRARDRLNEGLERTWGVRIEARIGVNTGEVVAGDSSAGERFATGDTVNVAARLEQAAAPGEILIGDETYRLVRDAVRVEPVEPLVLKGKAARVPAYRLIDVDLWAAGYTRRLDSPLVGRAAELEALRVEYDALQKSPTARLVTVLGAAGLGKSRLTNEFLAGLDGAGVLRGRCLSYGEGVSFWPVMEIVREAASILETDSAAQARAKIERLLPGDADSPLVLERVAVAVGLGVGAGSAEETFWGVRRLLEALAAQRPLVVVIDDCHWAASAMLDLIEYVSGWSRTQPILLVCLARPELLETRPAWPTTVALEALSDAESARLLENLVDGELDAPLRRRILETAEGNPLFLEQLVAFVREDPAATNIPPTIHALVAARLDHLATDQREAIERGAIEGKVFHRGAVQHLTPETTRAHVPAHLLTLVRKEFIGPESALFSGDDAFRFRNLVVRDAAYEAMPKQTRAELHEQFVDWLESVVERAPEYDEILAYHLEQAHGYLAELGPLDDHGRTLGERAAALYVQAGRLAMKRGDVAASSHVLERAAQLLPAGDPRRLELLPDLAFALRERGEFAQALAVAAEAEEHGDACTAARAQIEREMTLLLSDPSAMSADALAVAERVIPVLDALEDDVGLAKAWKLLSLRHWVGCNAVAAGTALEHATTHAKRAGERSEVIDILGLSAFVASFGPMPLDDALLFCDDLAEQAQGELSVLTSVYAARAQLTAMSGDFSTAREFAREARRLYDELGMRVNGLAFAQRNGEIELLAGDANRAEVLLRESVEALESLGERSYLSTMLAILADAVYAGGRYAEAEALARRACELGADEDIAAQASGRAVQAKATARLGRLVEAQTICREAVALADATDFVNFRGDMLLALGEVLELSGQADEASDAFRKALEHYELKGNIVSAAAARERLGRVAV